MLGRATYPQAYIDACRSRVATQLGAFRKLAAGRNRPGSAVDGNEKTFDLVETAFFNNMVIVLDGYFVHRLRSKEGKDGNPANEVRVMANSMMFNNDTMMADSTIKMNPAKSVLKYEVGQPIHLDARDFVLIFKAFFDEIERKYAA